MIGLIVSHIYARCSPFSLDVLVSFPSWEAIGPRNLLGIPKTILSHSPPLLEDNKLQCDSLLGRASAMVCSIQGSANARAWTLPCPHESPSPWLAGDIPRYLLEEMKP